MGPMVVEMWDLKRARVPVPRLGSAYCKCAAATCKKRGNSMRSCGVGKERGLALKIRQLRVKFEWRGLSEHQLLQWLQPGL